MAIKLQPRKKKKKAFSKLIAADFNCMQEEILMMCEGEIMPLNESFDLHEYIVHQQLLHCFTKSSFSSKYFTNNKS